MATVSQPETTPWTIGRLLSWTADFLGRQGVDDARLATEVLLAHAAKCRRIDLYAQFDRVLDAESITRFRESVKRAGNHEPIAYLVGEKEFFSLRFHVTPDVLIPRGETEELVECVVDLCRPATWETPRLWDLGTGSGCIAIAVLSQLPNATCLATDASPAAVEMTRKNADRHGVNDRMTIQEASQMALPEGLMPEGGFHILMCNPPYIPAAQMATLDRAVRDFEPRAALTDEGDGLSFYRVLARESPRWLSQDGFVAVEIADGCADMVKQIMTAENLFAHYRTRKDRTVGKERVLVFKKT
jgi:release factor glutamine methyltransferase